MKRGGHREIEVKDSTEEDGWLITYLDVITLLLVMFIVMLALSGGPSGVPGKDQAAAMSDPEPGSDESGILEGSSTPVPEQDQAARQSVDNVMEHLDISRFGDAIEVSEQAGQISFRISNDILFPSGEGMLTRRGFDELEKLVPLLQQTDFHVSVFGHTDNVPISTGRYPSNWELSSSRAASVVRYFIRRGLSPDRFSAVGLASTRPLADNESPEGRAMNRRVLLTLHRPGQLPQTDIIRVLR